MLRIEAKLSTYTEGVFAKRGNRRHKAQIGDIEGTGKTEREAQDALASAVVTAVKNIGRPLIMLDLIEPRTVWSAHQNSTGAWYYAIWRPAHINGTVSGAMREGGSGGSWDTRDEAIEHMRAHWYANNIEPIVRGIIGLCTDRREWVCERCNSVQQSNAPYRCRAPGCNGHEHK